MSEEYIYIYILLVTKTKLKTHASESVACQQELNWGAIDSY